MKKRIVTTVSMMLLFAALLFVLGKCPGDCDLEQRYCNSVCWSICNAGKGCGMQECKR